MKNEISLLKKKTFIFTKLLFFVLFLDGGAFIMQQFFYMEQEFSGPNLGCGTSNIVGNSKFSISLGKIPEIKC